MREKLVVFPKPVITPVDIGKNNPPILPDKQSNFPQVQIGAKRYSQWEIQHIRRRKLPR
jgi:hypothetical protein